MLNIDEHMSDGCNFLTILYFEALQDKKSWENKKCFGENLKNPNQTKQDLFLYFFPSIFYLLKKINLFCY